MKIFNNTVKSIGLFFGIIVLLYGTKNVNDYVQYGRRRPAGASREREYVFEGRRPAGASRESEDPWDRTSEADDMTPYSRAPND